MASSILALSGTAVAVVSALVMVIAAWRVKTTEIWRQEAEAQKARADRLLTELEEIKARLEALEKENRRLVELLTALDPERINSLTRP